MSDMNRRIPETYIKVSPNEYLSKLDPKFLEKYLKYFPNDGDKCYEYAKQLEAQGKKKKSIYYYNKALAAGYLSAAQDIKGLQESPKMQVEDNDIKHNSKKQIFLLGFLNFVFFTVLLLCIMTYLMYQQDLVVFANSHEEPSGGNSLQLAEKNCDSSSPPILLENEEIKNLPLEVIVINSAIQRYYEINNVYPSSLTELANGQFLTINPQKVNYSVTGDTYYISYKDKIYKGSNLAIELVHYPSVNKLAVQYGEELLALYPVASGAEPVSFSSSNVTMKVVNPNGGSGSLGTRGFELHDQYAIHGTNVPSSIGEYVTKGCIRLLNGDIETLFPYISEGTEVLIKPGEPQKSVKFPSGLPIVEESDILLQSLITREHFSWKN